MLIDTHSHISFKAYDKDRDEVIKRTREAGVICIDIGTKYETSKNAIELAEKSEGIYAAIGMHPIHIKTDLMKLRMDEEEGAFAPLGEEYDKEKYKELVLEDKKKGGGKNKIVAIGEIGLDYYYKPKITSRLDQFKELQKKVFIEQLDLAEELNLPVIVHCRMAFTDLYDILKTRKISGVIHCFTGNWEEAQKYINLGFYLGINGIIFSAQGGPASGWKLLLEEAVRNTPLDKLLIETDCPYLTPPKAGLKKTRNEPIFVKYVAEKIAELKGISFDEVASITTANARKLFKI
jgi:TatD DNase family protein